MQLSRPLEHYSFQHLFSCSKIRLKNVNEGPVTRENDVI